MPKKSRVPRRLTPQVQKTDAPKQAIHLDSFDQEMPAPEHELHTLQRTIGNQAVQRLIANGTISQQPRSGGFALQREPGFMKKVRVKSKPKVPTVIVDPRADWKNAPLQADPALMPDDRAIQYVVDGGKKYAKNTDSLVQSTHSLGAAFAFAVKDGKDSENYIEVPAAAAITLFDGTTQELRVLNSTYITPTFGRGTLPSSSDLHYTFAGGAGKTYYVPVASAALKKVDYFKLKTATTSADTYKVAEPDVREGSASFVAPPVATPLFGVGSPKPDDIKQTGLGDCYLQAVLMSVSQSNPAHFRTMLEDGATDVTVRFFRKNGKNWTPAFYKVSKTIASGVLGGSLYNEGGLWVHMIQKAYALFAQQYGQYGDAFSPPTATGYAGIDGGFEYQVYQTLYGDNSKAEQMGISGDNGSELKANKDIITQLVKLAGGAQYVKKGETINLNASANLRTAIGRAYNNCFDVIAAYSGSTDPKTLALANELIPLQASIKTAWDDMATDYEAPSVKTMAADVLAFLGKDFMSVLKKSRKSAMRALFDQLYDIKEAGTDNSTNERMIYTHHAYSVLGARFKDKAGANIPMGKSLSATVRTIIKLSDMEKSTVSMRNPHHTNSPSARSSAYDPNADSGAFTMSVAQFLRNFTSLHVANVKKT